MPHPPVQDENRGGRGRLLGRGQVERSKQENPTSGRVKTRAAKGIMVSHSRAVGTGGELGERGQEIWKVECQKIKSIHPLLTHGRRTTKAHRLSHVVGAANLKTNNSGSD